MKRVIAVSDSHGDVNGLKEVLELAQKQGRIDAAVFLGDGVADFRQASAYLTEKGTACHAVCGNNDWGSYEPQEIVFRVGKAVFYACHGHTRYVKYNLQRLFYAAREREAQVALFGHTHMPQMELQEGMYLINPGSARDRRFHKVAYAEILVEDNGAVLARLVAWPA